MLLPGWRRVTHASTDGESQTYYVGPDDEEYSTLQYAYESLCKVTKENSRQAQENEVTLQAMSRLLEEYKERHTVESMAKTDPGVSAAAAQKHGHVGAEMHTTRLTAKGTISLVWLGLLSCLGSLGWLGCLGRSR